VRKCVFQNTAVDGAILKDCKISKNGLLKLSQYSQ
jgi:hypothetical protein